MSARFVLLAIVSCIAIASGFLFKPRRPLAIDGGWSSWQSWTKCYLNLANSSNFFPDFNGFYVSSRQRICDSPRPVQGGKPCFGSAFKYRQCGCENPLGMESGRIQNNQLFSNARTFNGFNVSNGRFGSKAAWCSEDQISPFLNIYYEIDLVNFTKLASIATAGIAEGRVTRYRLYHSLNGKNWNLYTRKRQMSSELIGNILPNTVKINEFEDPVIARFLKIIPLHSYNRVCMKFEIYGCVFTCGREMTTATGEIIGRSAETHNQNCLWRIDVKNTTKISLDFVTFDIPCDAGFLEIRTGSDNFLQARVSKRLCGVDLTIDLLKLTSNALWLNFVSNSSSEEVGFRVRYISECSESLDIHGNDALKINSPNYPLEYFDNNDCTWTVTSGSNRIYAVFKVFDIEASKMTDSQECTNDFVLIQVVDEKGRPHKGSKFCNSKKPLTDGTPIVFDANQLSIRFKSDDVITGKGFLLELTLYDPRKGIPENRQPKLTTTNPHIQGNDRKDGLLETTKSLMLESTVFMSKVLASEEFHENNRPRTNNMTVNESQVKKKSKKEPDWTIITVASFSCFVFFLIVFVTVISVRKCTSRYHGESGKFLPAISKKQTKASQSSTNDVLIKSKKSFPVADGEEQLCELKSPAGSIQPAYSSSGSENDEKQPLKADIVNHALKREARTIDMYTDGENDTEVESSEAAAGTSSPSTVVEETVI